MWVGGWIGGKGIAETGFLIKPLIFLSSIKSDLVNFLSNSSTSQTKYIFFELLSSYHLLVATLHRKANIFSSIQIFSKGTNIMDSGYAGILILKSSSDTITMLQAITGRTLPQFPAQDCISWKAERMKMIS